MKKRVQFTALLSFDIEVELTDEQAILFSDAEKEILIERDTAVGEILTENLDFTKQNDWYFKNIEISDT